MLQRNDELVDRVDQPVDVLNELQLELLADMYQKYGHYEKAIDTLRLLLKLKKHSDPDFRKTA